MSSIARPVRPLSALVLATNSGESLRSSRPKPIHLLCGRPMLNYVLDTLAAVGVQRAAVVTGSAVDWISKRVMEEPPGFPLRFVEGSGAGGSADAALLGLTGFDDIDDEGDLLVVPADLPLLDPRSLERLVEEHRQGDAACSVLSIRHPDPTGSHRVVRDRSGDVLGVVDDLDLTGDEVEITEVPTDVYCLRLGLLPPAIRRISPDVVDGRRDLSALPGILAESGHPVRSVDCPDVGGVRPVDSRRQLAEAEGTLRRRINRQWMDRGVTMVDPERTYIDVTVQLGTDVTLFPGTILQGSTVIADGCEIGPDTRLDRCLVGRDSIVEKTMGRLASVGDECHVGPFAALEPGTEVGDGTSTGPFYAARMGE